MVARRGIAAADARHRDAIRRKTHVVARASDARGDGLSVFHAHERIEPVEAVAAVVAGEHAQATMLAEALIELPAVAVAIPLRQLDRQAGGGALVGRAELLDAVAVGVVPRDALDRARAERPEAAVHAQLIAAVGDVEALALEMRACLVVGLRGKHDTAVKHGIRVRIARPGDRPGALRVLLAARRRPKRLGVRVVALGRTRLQTRRGKAAHAGFAVRPVHLHGVAHQHALAVDRARHVELLEEEGAVFVGGHALHAPVAFDAVPRAVFAPPRGQTDRLAGKRALALRHEAVVVGVAPQRAADRLEAALRKARVAVLRIARMQGVVDRRLAAGRGRLDAVRIAGRRIRRLHQYRHLAGLRVGQHAVFEQVGVGRGSDPARTGEGTHACLMASISARRTR